jgi:ABC-2 type transport system ATP-binding protein
VPAAALRRRVPDLLARVGLDDRRREPIARLSKGMLQRLALAQAMLNDPELLVLDEPSEGLDLIGRRLVAEAIEERRRRGGSVLLVTHALSDVPRLCDRVAILVGGRVAHDGSPSSLPDPGPRGGGPRPLEHALERLYEVARR